MTGWVANTWDYLRTSFWFVPALMAVLGVAMAATLVAVDLRYPDFFLDDGGWLQPPEAEAVRTVLATLVGATITVLSVVFSITIVALTLAVSELGPRLLRTFTSDRGNQMVLGTFIATFLYCLLVLWTIDLFEATAVPHLATTGAFVLAVINAGVLIFFIHHMARSIQAPNVILAVGHELRQAICHIYPQRLEAITASPDSESHQPSEPLPDHSPYVLKAHRSGYVQSVELDHVLAIAKKHDLVIRILARPGRFVIHDMPIAEIWPADRADTTIEKSLRRAVLIGVRRTPTQDVEFAVDQLVEVALRALSPSINDAFTAMHCIDQLGASLCELCDRKIPPHESYDDAGQLRVVVDAATFHGITDAMLNQIRQMSRTNVAVTARLLEILETAMRRSCTQEQTDAIWSQAQAIHRAAMDAITEPYDREDLRRRFMAIAELMGKDD